MGMDIQHQAVLAVKEYVTYIALRRTFKEFQCLYAYRNEWPGVYELTKFSQSAPYSFLGLELVKGEVDFHKFKHLPLIETSRKYEFDMSVNNTSGYEELWFKAIELDTPCSIVITFFHDKENPELMRSVYLETFVDSERSDTC